MDYYKHDPLFCECCNYQARDNSTFNRHIKSDKHKRNSNTGGRFSCDICAKTFSSPQSLCNHKKECAKQNNLNDDKYYKDMLKVKDEQINFLKEQLEYFKKQNETLQNQVITLQNNNNINNQQITQPQNIIVNNQIPQPEKKKKRITITQANYKNNIPKIIKEPKQLNNMINEYYNYFDNSYDFNIQDTTGQMNKKAINIFKSFINNYDDENMFLYLGKNENNPSNIYYYGKEYNNKFIDDSNVEWYKIDYKDIEKMFINKLYSKLMGMFVKWNETAIDFNTSNIQDDYMTAMENINAFVDNIDTNKLYEIIYEKSGKNNSKK